MRALEGTYGFCDTKQTRKCDKIAWQKIGEPKGLADFLSRLLWSLVRSDKILSRRNTPVALVYYTRWQFFFLQSKQKFCLVRPPPPPIITKPDKGNGIFIVNELDCLNKIKQLISDETKFKKLTQNPTKSREDTACYHIYVIWSKIRHKQQW